MSTLSVDTIQGQTTAANVKLPGAVIQTVTTELNTTSGAGTITSASYTELASLRCTITPKLTGSKIYYRANIMCGNNHTGGSWFHTRLQVAGAVISENSFYANEQYDMIMNHVFHEGLDATTTTAGVARRYDSYFKGQSAVPLVINWGASPAGANSKSSITLMEIAQ